MCFLKEEERLQQKLAKFHSQVTAPSKYYKSGPLFWGHLWDYDKCVSVPSMEIVPLESTDTKIMCSGALIQGTH